MKKIILVALAVVLLVIGMTAGIVSAASNNPFSAIIIPESTQVNVASPFQVSAAIDNFLPADGKVYVGEKIANVRLIITNAGRIPYGTNIYVHPIKPPANGIWPSLDLRINTKTGIPNQLPVIAPGQKVELSVEIFIAYGSQTTSFQGLALDVFPAPETSTISEKG